MTPTINNTGYQERRAIMKTGMVRWYRTQQRRMAEQLRRIYGRED